MSGHSKWASIKHKKAAVDQKRGKIFSKLAKEITVAARTGGGDPDANARLRLVVQKARDANMPADNIDRAIKKGTGELPGVTYEEFMYEGYGPAGVALMVDVLTDNKNRAAADIRSIFSKSGGNMANPGAVAWIFSQKGYFLISKDKVDEDTLMNVALEAGAEDITTDDTENYEVFTEVKNFDTVRTALLDGKVSFQTGELTMIPSSTIEVTGSDAKKVLNLIEALEDNDDVQNVYANFDIPDDEMDALEA